MTIKYNYSFLLGQFVKDLTNPTEKFLYYKKVTSFDLK